VLTSMVKRVDNAVYDAVKEVLDGKFNGGFHVFGLDKDGVAYAMDQNNEPLISNEIIEKVENTKAKIINGEIKVTDAMAN
jgi:basic membrane protein A and related proteins